MELLVKALKHSSDELDEVIKNTPRLITIGKPPEHYLAKARNLLQAAITNILLAMEVD